MPKISIDMDKMEATVVFFDQLADMADALHIAMFEGPHGANNYRDASTLLVDLIGKHADTMRGLFNTAVGEQK